MRQSCTRLEPCLVDEKIVHVHAGPLERVDKQLASGSHYASPSELPCVCGSDRFGRLDDGQRVFLVNLDHQRRDGIVYGRATRIHPSSPEKCERPNCRCLAESWILDTVLERLLHWGHCIDRIGRLQRVPSGSEVPLLDSRAPLSQNANGVSYSPHTELTAHVVEGLSSLPWNRPSDPSTFGHHCLVCGHDCCQQASQLLFCPLFSATYSIEPWHNPCSSGKKPQKLEGETVEGRN